MYYENNLWEMLTRVIAKQTVALEPIFRGLWYLASP